MSPEKKMLTMWQMREKLETPFLIEDFVKAHHGSPPRPCLPSIVTPRHLINPEKRDIIEQALNTCVQLIGVIGEKEYSLVHNHEEIKEFNQAAEVFFEETGVNVFDVVDTTSKIYWDRINASQYV